MEQAEKVSYRPTVWACYLGSFTQAVVVNLTPILFLPLRALYGLSFTALGVLTLVNFLAQVAADLAFSHAVDRFGYRPFVAAASVLTLLGFTLFLLAPVLFPGAVLAGLLLGPVLFSVAGGLLEVLLSPIVNAIPTQEKDKAMSVLHSFYSWGQLVVVLITTLAVFFLRETLWQFIVLGWMAVPLAGLVLFLIVPMPRPVPEGEREKLRHMGLKSALLLFLAVMVTGGASEQIMAQWSSTFLQAGLGLPKIFGDMVGVCVFAAMMGLGRLCFGKLGRRINLKGVMIAGAGLSALCFLVVAFSPIPVLSVVFCGLTGLGVALLWPGTICMASEKYPKAGTWMFAMLACGGDVGAAVGPLVTGVVSDGVQAAPFAGVMAEGLGLTAEQLGLRAGLAVSVVFPLLCMVLLLSLLGRKRGK